MSPVSITILAMSIGAAIVLAVVVTMLRDRRPAEEDDGPGAALPLFGQVDARLEPHAAEDGVLAGGVVRRMARTEPMPAEPPHASAPYTAWAPPEDRSDARADAHLDTIVRPWSPEPAAAPVSSATVPYGVPVIPEPLVAASVAASVAAAGAAPAASAASVAAALAVVAPTPPAEPIAPQPVPAPALHAAGIPGTMKEWRQLRFSVPADGAVEFLPGRLVIESGPDQGREIRLANIRGPNGVEVTFGRGEGLPYRHVQLRDETVSRLHAGLRFAAGQWSLRNYSVTNPVVYNQTTLTGDDEPLLEDGDRIEMGAVTFSFMGR